MDFEIHNTEIQNQILRVHRQGDFFDRSISSSVSDPRRKALSKNICEI